ncbi:hypothetical protein EYZ11_007296 [Aspergillus tanneri]|uniref:ABC transporter domain-containing protein n=1 Tax=Aspergillus tanneri TaxID=1220188 RepID=A0A4V3UP09_9EURO|nr:hypothetical protein EYZ11_007296 [Aspergillus tanneri]
MVSPLQWRRIYHQTLTLVHKNLLVFYKSPVVTLIRAFIVPIAITIIFCFLKEIKNENEASYGISHKGQPVMDLPDAVAASSSQRLVFVMNNIQSPDLNGSLNAIFREPGMGQFDIQVVNDPRSLVDVCRQSIHGTSNCFASVIFTAFNKTNVEYSIGLDADPMYNTPYSYAPGQSIFSQRLLPLQWALDSHLGGFESALKPTEKMWNGYFEEDGSSPFKTGAEVYWLTIVQYFAATLFVFILLAATHHMSSAVAGERQNSVAELLMAQGVRTTPRVLSNLISFFILYAPGVIICSILLGEILFKHTSTGIMFILMLLACLSFIVSAHFIGSFFAKASLAGLCASILTFALGLVTVSQNLTDFKNPAQNIALSLLFPPYAWASVIHDIATLENVQHGFPDPMLSREGESIDGGLFFLFFILQILFYGSGTFLVEHFRWGVPRQREWTENSDEIALRLGHLTKTFDRGKKVAVEDLNVEVRKGSVTFLLGPNGSGKTTTLKCISGMLTVDRGSSIQFSSDGHSFGLCPQNNHVLIWAKLKTAGSDASASTDVDDVIAECGLTGKAHAASQTLSGGQKRRLQLAIAFSGGSKVCCIDEASSGLADVLADHIVIMCKGRLVCQGSSTALKAQYGDNYRIRVGDGEEIAWRATTSTEATKKVLELERLQDDQSCHVTFPTLEQVFLKTTSQFGTAVNTLGGDGMVGDSEPIQEDSTAIEDKILALESEYNGEDLNLDVRRSVGVVRQIWVLFQKRYRLLLQPSGMIVYAVNLLIPIIVAAALTGFMYKWDALVTCEQSYQAYINPTGLAMPPLENPTTYSMSADPGAILGPQTAFSGATQDALYAQSIAPTGEKSVRKFVNSEDAFNTAMDNSTGQAGFGLYAPSHDNAIFYHSASPYDSRSVLSAFSLITNRIANSTSKNQARQVSTDLRLMRHVRPVHDWRNMPIAILLVIVFMAPVSTAIIYPVYERVSNVRALQYSNGVTPFALWTAYLLFDVQFIILQGTIWYHPDCIFGAMILFGIASYLGTYLLSNILRRAGFAAALGIHMLLFVLYFIAYVAAQFGGPADSRQDTFDSIQAGLGLIAPAANLARALFIGMNTFDVLCGKYGDADTSYPFTYPLYGGVYANLIYQIVFLIIALALYEYGSADWFQPLFFWRRNRPKRLHHAVDNEGLTLTSFDSRRDIMLESPKHNIPLTTTAATNPILEVDRVTKYFGRSFAAQNVSLMISANETLALLGGNGAGKTTVINMIRGELKPNFGNVYVNGVSMLRQPGTARLHIGVCPQDDAVDNLTVRQTLEFYASVKGLKRIKDNVDQVMNALDISAYENVKARALSGGTKRKLTVAIALLGNPPLLLLDEPSTALDAGAKRILWRALKRIRPNRAILLTTHSMEEAESLASNVAIMRTKILVSGPLRTLNESYGGAFRLRGVRCAEVSSEVAAAQVKTSFARLEYQVKKYVDVNGLVQFFVQYEKRDLGKIMTVMEALKGEVVRRDGEGGPTGGTASEGTAAMKVFEDYTLIEPTLEEVFMNVVREAEGSEGL